MTEKTMIQFDTVLDDGITKIGILEDDVLRTEHGAQADYRIEDDWTVTMLSAKTDHEIEEFGTNVKIIE